jgi:uncharacterized protein YbjT (DUF2867 family)
MQEFVTQGAQKIVVAGATGRVGRHVVEVLRAGGHEVVPISRATGVDVITGQGLPTALRDASCIIDVATGPSAEQGPATEFFTTAAGNLHAAGAEAGVSRMVVVSIIGCDQFETGYSAAKAEHERAALVGPTPVQIVRAAQFHEFVPVLMAWGDRGEVCFVPKMRTQLVSARTVAESLVYYATAATWPADPPRGSVPRDRPAGSHRVPGLSGQTQDLDSWTTQPRPSNRDRLLPTLLIATAVPGRELLIYRQKVAR